MRWRQGRRSSNVEDRRGARVSRKKVGGGLGVLVLALVAMYFGVDPSIILNLGGSVDTSTSSYSTTPSGSGAKDEMAQFVSVVLADTEDTWTELQGPVPAFRP